MAAIADHARMRIDVPQLSGIHDAAGDLCAMAHDILALNGGAMQAVLDVLPRHDIGSMMAGALPAGSAGAIGAAEVATSAFGDMGLTRAFEQHGDAFKGITGGIGITGLLNDFQTTGSPIGALADIGLSRIGGSKGLAEGLESSTPWTALTSHAGDLATMRAGLATAFGPTSSAADALGIGSMKHGVNGLKGALDELKLPAIDFPSFPLPTIPNYQIAPPSPHGFDMPLSPSVYRDIEQLNALRATTEAIQEQNEILRQAFDEERNARLSAEAKATEDHRLTLSALDEARRQRIAAERSLRLTQRTVAITIAGVVFTFVALLISTL
ncbi:MAG: hypothetical protein ABI565_14760 [Vicinamibacteria bacterium]